MLGFSLPCSLLRLVFQEDAAPAAAWLTPGRLGVTPSTKASLHRPGFAFPSMISAQPSHYIPRFGLIGEVSIPSSDWFLHSLLGAYWIPGPCLRTCQFPLCQYSECICRLHQRRRPDVCHTAPSLTWLWAYATSCQSLLPPLEPRAGDIRAMGLILQLLEWCPAFPSSAQLRAVKISTLLPGQSKHSWETMAPAGGGWASMFSCSGNKTW